MVLMVQRIVMVMIAGQVGGQVVGEICGQIIGEVVGKVGEAGQCAERTTQTAQSDRC